MKSIEKPVLDNLIIQELRYSYSAIYGQRKTFRENPFRYNFEFV